MSTALALVGFTDDPIAPHSAQFPLGRIGGPPDHSVASEPNVRPWGLGGMRPARQQGDPVRAASHYDHATQTAIDGTGRTLVAADPTANKVSSSDGDEGPSEDFTYDFCPDDPTPA
jgi:putative ATP-grasp target RiPP